MRWKLSLGGVALLAAACNVLGGIEKGQPVCSFDDTQNGFETDVDCGGGCGLCPALSGCEAGSDCLDGICENNVCLPPPCVIDNVQNGNETDVDCGGGCGVCRDFYQCIEPDDCASGSCFEVTEELLLCIPPLCFDAVLNGYETGVDCGGSLTFTCNRCTGGAGCREDTDCASFFLAEALGTNACVRDGVVDELDFGECLSACCFDDCEGCIDMLCPSDNTAAWDSCCYEFDQYAACCTRGCGPGVYGDICMEDFECADLYNCVELVPESMPGAGDGESRCL